MASSLLNFVYNLAKGIHKIKCEYEHENEKCLTCGIKYKGCDWCFEYTNIKGDLMEYLCCKFDENLNKRFVNRYNVLTTKSISLFRCCKKVFTHMTT